ncbi:DUF4062 domain-containing protein [Kribbella antibiotica]|uniref:DUF4062 domain-containing protein n=1 Tax=Kribbella antibiotica TaxID=190195 RepID=A0A4R4YX66_9ACTN|nr:DUF4062 domain-containing protein [Kribbella antibiotica]TDD50075.1 DUF4062 domain-containing protein [Kribbella antibiotica]
MKVFISSVRRGLEEERDALPGLISAIGHTPLRFEDFSAQAVPSREACIAGVQAADAYLLLLGPNYGHRFEDTGQSPTHDEWIAATATGLPRLVYRKDGVDLEPDQEAFVRRIGDYRDGLFYDTFRTTHDLLTKVAAKIIELDRAPSPLEFAPLSGPVTVTWRSDYDARFSRTGSSPTALELHVVPIGQPSRSARQMMQLAETLPDRIREARLVAASEALDVIRAGDSLQVNFAEPIGRWREVQESKTIGIRVGADGQVSAWASLPRDGLGSILDPVRLPDQVADLLRLIGNLGVLGPAQIAIAAGVEPSTLVSVGRADGMPRQSARILMSGGPIRAVPDELVSASALSAGAAEVALAVSRRIVDAAEAVR